MKKLLLLLFITSICWGQKMYTYGYREIEMHIDTTKPFDTTDMNYTIDTFEIENSTRFDLTNIDSAQLYIRVKEKQKQNDIIYYVIGLLIFYIITLYFSIKQILKYKKGATMEKTPLKHRFYLINEDLTTTEIECSGLSEYPHNTLNDKNEIIDTKQEIGIYFKIKK